MFPTRQLIDAPRIRGATSEVRVTLAVVALLWTTAAVQYDVLPWLGVSPSEPIRAVGVTLLDPYNVGRWFASMFLHVSYSHLIDNTIPLLILGAYYERTRGWRRMVGLATAIGLATYGAYIIGVAPIEYAGTEYYVVGASAVWYGLVSYGAVNRDALTIPRLADQRKPLGKSNRAVIPFWVLLLVCLAYILGAYSESGVFSTGPSHEAHVVSLVVGAAFGVFKQRYPWWGEVKQRALSSRSSPR